MGPKKKCKTPTTTPTPGGGRDQIGFQMVASLFFEMPAQGYGSFFPGGVGGGTRGWGLGGVGGVK